MTMDRFFLLSEMAQAGLITSSHGARDPNICLAVVPMLSVWKSTPGPSGTNRLSYTQNPQPSRPLRHTLLLHTQRTSRGPSNLSRGDLAKRMGGAPSLLCLRSRGERGSLPNYPLLIAVPALGSKSCSGHSSAWMDHGMRAAAPDAGGSKMGVGYM